MSSSATTREELAALAWSLWAELGASGWERHHRRWFVDPEALVVFTAWLGDTDARLRDEATDWCVRYGTWLSATRLANLLAGASDGTRERFGELAATVCEHSPLRWRGATRPRKYNPTGRSRLDSFAAASLIGLRIRGIVGVGARAEVVRLMLAAPDTSFSASDLVEDAGFKKRNVADALDSLRWGGVLAVERSRNQLRYRLVDAQGWRTMLGELPTVWLHWTSVFPTLAAVADGEERANRLPDRVRNVELSKLVRDNSQAIVAARMPTPPAPGPEIRFAEAFSEWFARVVSEVVRGTPWCG
jgi:hypothetical protein